MKRVNMRPGFVFSPQPMYLIGTNNEDGSENFCIITWLGFSADSGPCLMMTIGGRKLTARNILRDGRFSANLITEDNLWLADYFGSLHGDQRKKNAVPYSVSRGRETDVPVLEQSPWVYECEVVRHVPMDGADLFVARITNIQIDEAYRHMDMEHIDLSVIRPAVYSPYQYFAIGEKIGEMGEWRQRIGLMEASPSTPEKAN